MRKALTYLLKICCAGIIAIILLSVFVFFYGYSSAHVENKAGATDYKWEPSAWRTTMAEGFSWLEMDRDGFNNQWEHQNDIDILLMGSSHMEAINVGYNESTAWLLNENLSESGLYCYNIAMSGHTLCRCVHNISAAIEQYAPLRYVVIETSSILPSKSEMTSILSGDYSKIPSYDSGLLYYLQKIPAIKAVYQNLISLLTGGVASAEEEISGNVQTPEEDYAGVLTEFMTYARDSSGDAQLMIVYHPQVSINADGSLSASASTAEIKEFSIACENAGILFVDMSDSFIENYYESYELPYGFINTQIGSGHLNANGHRMIAEQLCKTIFSEDIR